MSNSQDDVSPSISSINNKLEAINVNSSDNLSDEQEKTREISGEQFDLSPRAKIRKWLNKSMRIKITDGRVIIGTFLCTDKQANVIMGSCLEYVDSQDISNEPRSIGLSMIPGNHIVSIDVDEPIVN